ncbi:MAG: DUF1194 domain-containing protein [Azospirillum sp.]|nr:DUF1194 domain-containing protein [Azospirillum sp.]
MSLRWPPLFLAALVLCAGPAAAGDPGAARPLDLALVLAVDGSASISDAVLAFQLRGQAAALRDASIIEAIRHGPRGVAAVTLAVFSGPGSLSQLVPWTIVSDQSSAEAAAAAIAAATGRPQPGATALGSAILGILPLFETCPGTPARRVIDLVSNGFSNAGIEPVIARDRAAATGVTINALAILDEYPWLDRYFEENLIGGPAAFVETAEAASSFVRAIRHKLISEIADLPRLIE